MINYFSCRLAETTCKLFVLILQMRSVSYNDKNARGKAIGNNGSGYEVCYNFVFAI